MNREHLMNRLERTLKAAAALALITAVVACSAGGPATQVNQPTNSPTANGYTGPASANADVQAFKINLWENIRASNRCGGCHHAGGQSPMFARSDDVHLASQAVRPRGTVAEP